MYEWVQDCWAITVMWALRLIPDALDQWRLWPADVVPEVASLTATDRSLLRSASRHALHAHGAADSYLGFTSDPATCSAATTRRQPGKLK